MSEDQFMILIVKYDKDTQDTSDQFVERLSETIITKRGEVELIYHGSDNRVVSALKSILSLIK